MGVREQAEADLAVTLEAPGDFGVPIVLRDPTGFDCGGQPIYGQSGDIGLLIDPDTGLAVTGRSAHVAVRISTLTHAGYTTLPRAIPDAGSSPWLVTFSGQTFKVKEARPDRTLGIVTMIVEFWRALP
jgi:hypothetical protein